MNLSTKTIRSAVALSGLGLIALITASTHAPAQGPTVIELTQTGCQFIEPEMGMDFKYKTAKSADCKKINAQTGAKRLAEASVLNLKPGKYVFRVTNKNVPYQLGFWLREEGYQPGNPLHKLNKTSVSGGGLTLGTSKNYEVELKPGEYVYSCPLNPTPNYKIKVSL